MIGEIIKTKKEEKKKGRIAIVLGLLAVIALTFITVSSSGTGNHTYDRQDDRILVFREDHNIITGHSTYSAAIREQGVDTKTIDPEKMKKEECMILKEGDTIQLSVDGKDLIIEAVNLTDGLEAEADDVLMTFSEGSYNRIDLNGDGSEEFSFDVLSIEDSTAFLCIGAGSKTPVKESPTPAQKPNNQWIMPVLLTVGIIGLISAMILSRKGHADITITADSRKRNIEKPVSHERQPIHVSVRKDRVVIFTNMASRIKQKALEKRKDALLKEKERVIDAFRTEEISMKDEKETGMKVDKDISMVDKIKQSVDRKDKELNAEVFDILREIKEAKEKAAMAANEREELKNRIISKIEHEETFLEKEKQKVVSSIEKKEKDLKKDAMEIEGHKKAKEEKTHFEKMIEKEHIKANIVSKIRKGEKSLLKALHSLGLHKTKREKLEKEEKQIKENVLKERLRQKEMKLKEQEEIQKKELAEKLAEIKRRETELKQLRSSELARIREEERRALEEKAAKMKELRERQAKTRELGRKMIEIGVDIFNPPSGRMNRKKKGMIKELKKAYKTGSSAVKTRKTSENKIKRNK